MKKYILIALLLFSTPAYSTPACYLLASVGETVMEARQSGMPAFAVKAALQMSGISTHSMKMFTSALVKDAYSMPRVENNKKEKMVKTFSNSLYIDCKKLIKLHETLK